MAITAFGAMFGTGLYALAEKEWWFGWIYTIGGASGLLAMSPLVRSHMTASPSRRLVWVAVIATWLFLAANIGLSIYTNIWPPVAAETATAPTVIHDPPSADDIAKATAPLQEQLAAMTKARDDLQRQNDALRAAAAPSAASPPLQSPLPPKMSAEEAATRTNVWEKMEGLVSELTVPLNQGYILVENWADPIKTDRQKFLAALVAVRNGIDTPRRKFWGFRGTYSYPDLLEETNPSPVERLYNEIQAAVTEIATMPDPLPNDYEYTLRSYFSSVARSLNATKSWQADMQKLSMTRRKEISETR